MAVDRACNAGFPTATSIKASRTICIACIFMGSKAVTQFYAGLFAETSGGTLESKLLMEVGCKPGKLGNSDSRIIRMAYGAWRLAVGAGSFHGGADGSDSVAAIDRSLELGVNWINNAAAYGLGHSEEIVVLARKSCRAKQHGARIQHATTDYPSGEWQYTVEDFAGHR